MAFLTDTQELKPGLIIFRRADVKHHNWYCRIKVPKEDRYKTVSLKTSDINEAEEMIQGRKFKPPTESKRQSPTTYSGTRRASP